MAGHSKWANIKRRKAVQDAKKGQAYAKFSRDIIVAAKIGGGDPEGNFRLRTAIEQAKASGMPNDNIKRAIEKGIGSANTEQWESVAYEGYGPSGVAVFIETLTDNRNRTAGDIRSYFNKYQGNLGSDGCVAWMFEEKGLIRVQQLGVSKQDISEEELFDKAIEAGAQDFQVNSDEGVYEIYTDPTELNTVCQALANVSIAIDSAEVTRNPQNTVMVTDPDAAKNLMKLLDAIESHDDVQAVYANFEMDDALLELIS
jgi:YebC/PmpR family DNA-binding regulatory protein